MKIDHHLHTSRHSPDSTIDPLELVEYAREIGLDGLVITEHDHQWETDELAELAARAAPLRVFSGAEISAFEGHFLVYGLPALDLVPPGIQVADLVRVIRQHGAAIVAAHPFRWDQPFDAIVSEHGPVFDALELVSNNISAENRSRTDAHELETVGCYFTEFEGRIDSISDFVSGLRGRRGRPCHRPGAQLASGPVDY
jgi:PHP domain